MGRTLRAGGPVLICAGTRGRGGRTDRRIRASVAPDGAARQRRRYAASTTETITLTTIRSEHPRTGLLPAPPRRQAAVVVVAVLGATTVAHLAAQLTGNDAVADVTQWFLMPLLALALWLAAGPASGTRVVRLAVVALGLSWLGDTAPDVAPEDLQFLTMLGFFLLAHIVYLVAFWPLRDDGVLGRRRVLVLPYLAALVALVAACAPGAGDLLVPVILYGTGLTAMAVLATFDRVAAVGGVLFIVSDSLIALNAFVDGYALPGHGFWVMLTYVAAQALLAVGVLRVARTPRADLPVHR